MSGIVKQVPQICPFGSLYGFHRKVFRISMIEVDFSLFILGKCIQCRFFFSVSLYGNNGFSGFCNFRFASVLPRGVNRPSGLFHPNYKHAPALISGYIPDPHGQSRFFGKLQVPGTFRMFFAAVHHFHKAISPSVPFLIQSLHQLIERQPMLRKVFIHMHRSLTKQNLSIIHPLQQGGCKRRWFQKAKARPGISKQIHHTHIIIIIRHIRRFHRPQITGPLIFT